MGRKKEKVGNFSGLGRLYSGKTSKMIKAVGGCTSCPWRRHCSFFDPDSKVPCAARLHYLKNAKLEIGNVEQNLFERALVLRDEVSREAERIQESGESPVQNRAWREMNKLDLELAKWLVKLKVGSRQTIRVERGDPDVIEVNPKASEHIKGLESLEGEE